MTSREGRLVLGKVCCVCDKPQATLSPTAPGVHRGLVGGWTAGPDSLVGRARGLAPQLRAALRTQSLRSAGFVHASPGILPGVPDSQGRHRAEATAPETALPRPSVRPGAVLSPRPLRPRVTVPNGSERCSRRDALPRGHLGFRPPGLPRPVPRCR